MPLLTPERARQLALPSLTTGAEDTLLTALIAAADQAIAKWAGYPLPDSGSRSMLAAAYTHYIDRPWSLSSQVILLPAPRPVNSITSVYEDTTGRGAYATLVAATDYTLDAQAGELHRWDGGWATGRRYTRVIVNAGHTTAPADLELGAALLVREFFDKRKRLGIGQASTEGESQVFDGEGLLMLVSFPTEVRRLLGPYRMGEVGIG